VLVVGAALGRKLTPDDDQTPGGHPVTVMSYKCWQQRFGLDPEIIGKEVIVNGRNYSIVGVTPQGFNGTEVISSPEFFFSLAMQEPLEPGQRWLTNRSADNVFLQARLKPGVSIGQAQASLNTIAAQLEREFPDSNEGKRVVISPPGLVGTALRGPVIGFAALMMAVVGLVLLLACTNLANLLLARAAERRREIAVRLALGASRGRLIRQLLTESVMLAFAGGALGLVPALWLVGLVGAFKVPLNVPLALEVHIDYRVFGFAFLLSLATGILFGLLPALQATKTNLIPALKDEVAFGGHRRSWIKSGLIVAQISFSMVLLVGGGLMVRA
jgi:predicted permease